MKYIIWLQRFEAVYGSSVAASGRRLLLQLKPMSVSSTMDLEAMFCGLQDLVVNFCAGTMSVATPCLLLSEHLRFVKWKKGGGCVKDALPVLIAAY